MSLHRVQLVEWIERKSQPLAPQPTDTAACLADPGPIEAVVFDVYGTLVVSGSGDVGTAAATNRAAAAAEAVAEALAEGHTPDPSIGAACVDALVAAITADHAKHRAQGVEHPEVEIRDIWRQIAPAAIGSDLTLEQAERLSIAYECRVNPTWPMPGMTDTLSTLRELGLALGIVSNAQFFTPLLFGAFAGAEPIGLGFDPALCAWSYEHHLAKPGTELYQLVAEQLRSRGIAPDRVLYVGNDMLNDVWPASRIGFKTVLFAGDKRSLRLREGDHRIAGIAPTAIVTELTQLIDLVSRGA